MCAYTFQKTNTKSPPFPLHHTGHATFIAHGVPSDHAIRLGTIPPLLVITVSSVLCPYFHKNKNISYCFLYIILMYPSYICTYSYHPIDRCYRMFLAYDVPNILAFHKSLDVCYEPVRFDHHCLIARVSYKRLLLFGI